MDAKVEIVSDDVAILKAELAQAVEEKYLGDTVTTTPQGGSGIPSPLWLASPAGRICSLAVGRASRPLRAVSVVSASHLVEVKPQEVDFHGARNLARKYA